MSTTEAMDGVKRLLKEQAREQLLPMLERLIDALPEELSDLSKAEEQIRSGILRAARHLLQLWSTMAESRAETPSCPHCQQTMRHKGYKECVLATTVGTIRLRRPRWRCLRCNVDCYPHDAKVRFFGRSVSWPLAQVVTRLAVQVPFGSVRTNLLADYGVRLSRQIIQQLSEQAGAVVLEQEDQQRRTVAELSAKRQEIGVPIGPLKPEKSAVFADGTMIHVAGQWREIRVGCVASHDDQGRIVAQERQARFLAVEDFGLHLYLMARRQGYHQARLRCFVADGAHWLWELAATHFPEAILILDWYHLDEHVSQTAVVLFGEGTSEAQQWRKLGLEELWNGQVRKLLRRLQEHRKTRRGDKREALRQLIVYLENNRERVDYPRYRELGLPVGSGRAEGSCKHLVGARCKQAGMRNWTQAGVEGILRMRAAFQDGSYDRLWHDQLKTAA